jgi:hypothetical protein
MARGAWIAYARIAEIGELALAATRARLNAADRARYRYFATPRRRREFLAGRWLVAASRAAWRKQGRIGANIAHSGGWVACALLERGAPGVDIEPMVARDFAKLGAWAFPPRDAEPWPRSSRDARRAFYGRWTRYEARLKGSRSGAYGERTWYVDGVALSARLPRKVFLKGARPQRWRRRGGFAPATLKAGNFERR